MSLQKGCACVAVMLLAGTTFSQMQRSDKANVAMIHGEHAWMTIAAGRPRSFTQAAFTPSANHTVTEIDVGAGYSGQGTNGIVVSLNLDRNGKPGKALKKWAAANLPTFGTCCGMVTVTDSSGIQINGAQQYWVVLSTNKTETDTVDGWNVDDTDQVNMSTLASYSGTKWVVFQASPGLAFAVSGSN